MKSFQDFLNGMVNEKDYGVDTLDTLHDPGIRSYYSRHRVTPQNRKDFEIMRKIMMITLESGPTARRRLGQLLHQLAATTVPEIKPLVNQLGVFTAQDGRDAMKLFDPDDIRASLGGGQSDDTEDADDEFGGTDTPPEHDDVMDDPDLDKKSDLQFPDKSPDF